MEWIAIGIAVILLIALAELNVMALPIRQRVAAVGFVMWLGALVFRQTGSFPVFQGHWIHWILVLSVLVMICDRVIHFRSKSSQS